jgi:3-oxoacyl-[acyl-carrier protein] reductase
MPELVAVVTGASQGIGRATALRLAKDFSALVLAARDGKALKEVAAEVKSSLTGTSVRWLYGSSGNEWVGGG